MQIYICLIKCATLFADVKITLIWNISFVSRIKKDLCFAILLRYTLEIIIMLTSIAEKFNTLYICIIMYSYTFCMYIYNHKSSDNFLTSMQKWRITSEYCVWNLSMEKPPSNLAWWKSLRSLEWSYRFISRRIHYTHSLYGAFSCATI